MAAYRPTARAGGLQRQKRALSFPATADPPSRTGAKVLRPLRPMNPRRIPLEMPVLARTASSARRVPGIETSRHETRESAMNLVPAASQPPFLPQHSDATLSGLRPIDAAAREVDLWKFAARLWRRKLAIIVLAFVLFVPAALAIFLLTPLYHAEAVVMIDGSKADILHTKAVLPGISVPQEDPVSVVQSEIQVITSQQLAKRVIAKLGLLEDPEFNPALRPPSFAKRLLGPVVEVVLAWAMDAWERLVGPTAPGGAAAQARTRAPMAVATEIFGDKLGAAPVGRSRAIRIFVEATSPETATRIVNTVADLYVADQRDAKVAATKAANEWLQARAEELRGEVERSRAEGGLLRGKDATLIAQQISEVSSQLTAARERQSEAEARLAETRKLAAAKGVDRNGAKVVDSPHLQLLRLHESELLQRKADLLTRYGPKYPPVAEINAELVQLRATLKGESDRVIQEMQSDVGRERANVERLASALALLRTRLAEANQAAAHVTTLERGAISKDALYQNLVTRMQETGIEAAVQQPDSVVLSFADPPALPFFPNKHTLLPLALLTSLILAAGAVLALDSRKKGFLAPHELDGALPAGALGLIPTVRGLQSTVDAPGILAAHRSRSAFVEAIGSLHVRLLISSSRRPKSVLIASALPGEGKSSTAMALALLIAKAGRRAVIIDCDIRRPHLDEAFGLARSPGVTEFLTGVAGLSEIVHRNERFGIDIVPAGKAVSHPGELIGSERMPMLLDGLTASHELVIIDSPPLMAVSDALVLAPLADKTVFLVRWAKTPRRIAARALKMLVDADADLAGTMLSLVRLDKLVKHDFEGDYDASVYRYYQA